VDFLHDIGLGLSVSLLPQNLLACFVGVFLGTAVGVLPGIGSVATMSVLLPVTNYVDPATALIMLAGIYYGSQYGGSTTAILVNIPGEASSVVTSIEGYRMARQGRAGVALGVSAIGSFVGGTFSVLMIMLLAIPLTKAALALGPPEICVLLVLAFALATAVIEGSKIKGAAMAVLGLLLSTVGLDVVYGVPRFSFGVSLLFDGIGLVPMVTGLFGISEVLLNLERPVDRSILTTGVSRLLPNREEVRACVWPVTRGSLIGFLLGILPGFGTVIPPLIAYGVEKRLAKQPERFGNGAIEGVAAPESANNAAAGGGMVPLLTLGIPGNVVIALLLGALLTHGVQAGPLLAKEHPEIFWGVIFSMYVSNIMLLMLNLPLIGLWVQLLRVPYGLMFPIILLLCAMGVYSTSGEPWDVGIMLIFGVLGYLMRKFGYEPAPIVLAFVLGKFTEEAARQSLLISGGSLGIFIERPICQALLAAALVGVIARALVAASRRRRSEISTASRL
jgi:putative tricarboxylic transport membrane protein